MPAVRPSRRPCGVTLIELILTLVVLAVLVAVLAPVTSTGINAYIEGRRLADRERQASLALERFVRDIRRAGEVNLEEREDGEKVLVIDINSGTLEYSFDAENGELLIGDKTIASEVDGATFFETTLRGASVWSLELTIQNLPPYQATGKPRPQESGS